MKTIGVMIAEYYDEKRNYLKSCEDLRSRAIELGMDNEYSKDIVKVLSFLEGYRANPSLRSFGNTLNKALDLIEAGDRSEEHTSELQSH